ncbi:hypothetical protein RQP46_011380 [Phenoliferia psychrophenolica]
MSNGNATASSSYAFSLYPGAGTSTPRAPPPPEPVPPIEIDPSLSAAHPPRAVPDVGLGRTRCYWAVLSPSLDFVFVDPILHTHLADESPKFVGTNLLDYVHPEEVKNLRKDLVSERGPGSGGVESGGVFGSVTRCRYSRVSRIRKLLGCADPPVAPNASQYAYDADYLELQITTSWIGGPASSKDHARGAVLAFFHATADIDASKDNNEQSRSNWTNWCGPNLKDGSYLDPVRCQQLLATLMHVTGTTSPEPEATNHDEGPPPHVFQILDHAGEVIVSFPSATAESTKQYDPAEYATLAKEVVARPRGVVDANTSCTRRYRSKHPIMKHGTLTTIESVVILYGSITFAIFQTGGVYLPAAPSPKTLKASPPLTGIAGLGASHFELENVPPTSAPVGPAPVVVKRERDLGGVLEEGEGTVIKRQRRKRIVTGPTVGTGTFNSVAQPPLSIATSLPVHYTPSLGDHASATGGALSPTVASASAILGSFSSISAQHDNSYDYNRQHQHPDAYHVQSQPQHHLNPAPNYQSHPLHQSQYPPYGNSLAQYQQLAPHSYPSTDYAQASSSSSTSKLPPLRPMSDGAASPGGEGSPGSGKSSRAKAEPISKVGPKACESCGIINSPEWRKGPSGVKSLCNACGLRYARSVARKNKIEKGEVTPSKKAKAAAALAAAATSLSSSATTASPPPSHSPTLPQSPHTRPPSAQSYDMNSFKAGPGSPSSHGASSARPYANYPAYPTSSSQQQQQQQQPSYAQPPYATSHATYSSIPAFASTFGEPSPAARAGNWSLSSPGLGTTSHWATSWRGDERQQQQQGQPYDQSGDAGGGS